MNTTTTKTCETCNGSGKEPWSQWTTRRSRICGACGGKGIVSTRIPNSDSNKSFEQTKNLKKTFTFSQLLEAAESLLDIPHDALQKPSEYERGVCELIGRFMLDHHGIGEGTAENAQEIAKLLHIDGNW